MAIRKQARNIDIIVRNDYKLLVGNKLEKKAERVNVESMNANLTLVAGKKIISKGNMEN